MDATATYDPAIIGAAQRIQVGAREMLHAVEAVSLARRGNNEWCADDVQIAESCVGALLAAIIGANRQREREAKGRAELEAEKTD